MGFILFNEDGSIQEKHVLSSEGPVFGIDVQPGVYHSIVCLSKECICFEGKSGPYDPQTDKEFAIWSPSESDPKKTEYLEFLRNLF